MVLASGVKSSPVRIFSIQTHRRLLPWLILWSRPALMPSPWAYSPPPQFLSLEDGTDAWAAKAPHRLRPISARVETFEQVL